MTVNIEDLTIAQCREIAAMIGQVPASATQAYKSPHIGKTCLIRTYASGVHVGVLVNHQDRMVELVTARRLWAWHTVTGISLSDVATGGIDAKKSRVCDVVLEMTITDALEIIPMSDPAKRSVYDAPVDTGR